MPQSSDKGVVRQHDFGVSPGKMAVSDEDSRLSRESETPGHPAVCIGRAESDVDAFWVQTGGDPALQSAEIAG